MGTPKTLSDNVLRSICDELRTLAESSHCPSEVIAAERFLYEKQLNEGFCTDPQPTESSEISELFKKALDNESDDKAIDAAKQLAIPYQKLGNTTLVRTIIEKTPFRIRFVFSDELDKEEALLFEDNEYEWFIVLPKCRQTELVRNNASNGENFGTAVENKERLRWLTLHELAHILISTYDRNEGKNEENANKLTDLMLEKKMERNEQIRAAQLSDDRSALSRTVKKMTSSFDSRSQ